MNSKIQAVAQAAHEAWGRGEGLTSICRRGGGCVSGCAQAAASSPMLADVALLGESPPPPLNPGSTSFFLRGPRLPPALLSTSASMESRRVSADLPRRCSAAQLPPSRSPSVALRPAASSKASSPPPLADAAGTRPRRAAAAAPPRNRGLLRFLPKEGSRHDPISI
jgi:hypothetical protein